MAQVIANTVTVTTTPSALLPIERIPPAPGILGHIIFTNSGAQPVTITPAGSPTGHIIPAGASLPGLYLAGSQVTAATTSGTSTLSYTFTAR